MKTWRSFPLLFTRGGVVFWQEAMAWAWNKAVNYVLVEAWSGLRVCMDFTCVPSSLIAGGSREGRGLVLASTLQLLPPPPQHCNYYPPSHPAPTLMQADIAEGVCWAIAALLTQRAGSVFRIPVLYLNVWILVSPSMVGCPHCSSLVSEKSLG